MKSYEKVHDRLRDAILSGAYAYGSRLPSKREVARESGASLVTVEHAYRLLCDEGYVESRERSGFFVVYRDDDGVCANMSPVVSTLASSDALTPPRPNYHHQPDEFPFSVLTRTLRGVLTRYGERLLIKSPNLGVPELREAIARYLVRARGFRVDPGQIVIGSGAEYLYGLIAQMFRGEAIAIEDPSYAKIREVYQAHGVKLMQLRLGMSGISSEDLSATRASILHVTPYRSFPSGVTTDASKRHEYVRWAIRREGLLIEDDFESEFSAAGKGTETLFALEGGKRVLYLNTFSKTIAPSLRIGYLVLPKALVKLFSDRVGFYSCTVPVLDQFFLTDYLESGAFERHLARMRRKFNTLSVNRT